MSLMFFFFLGGGKKKESEDMVKVGLSYEEGCYRVRKKSYCQVDKIRCIEWIK